MGSVETLAKQAWALPELRPAGGLSPVRPACLTSSKPREWRGGKGRGTRDETAFSQVLFPPWMLLVRPAALLPGV